MGRVTSLLAAVFLISQFAIADEGIYSKLWQLDKSENGFSVAIEGTPQAKKADVVVSPQAAYVPMEHEKDQATHPLFHSVDEKKLSKPTYAALLALFDNYEFESAEPEDQLGKNPEEDKEIGRFLSSVLETKVFKLVLEDVNKRKLAGKELTSNDLKEELKRIWFEPYTNYYRTSVSKKPVGARDCIGFEHVFVGEQNSSDGIGGYHNWYKFYLEEKAGKVNYLGHNLPGVPHAEEIADVATFAMTWDTPIGEAFKKVTGFLVGVSPELQLAWGTLAFYESVHASDTADTLIPVQLPNVAMELVLYREMLKATRDRHLLRGDQVRTFYPKVTHVGPPAKK